MYAFTPDLPEDVLPATFYHDDGLTMAIKRYRPSAQSPAKLAVARVKADQIALLRAHIAQLETDLAAERQRAAECQAELERERQRANELAAEAKRARVWWWPWSS